MKAVVGVLVVVMASGCNEPELACGDGTVELDGVCEAIICGEGTVLVGDHCEPVDPPTCRIESVTDPATGLTTYHCTYIECPTPASSGKQSVCGQLYDFADNTPFQSYTQECPVCDPQNPTTAGPCALKITAYDAQALAA